MQNTDKLITITVDLKGVLEQNKELKTSLGLGGQEINIGDEIYIELEEPLNELLKALNENREAHFEAYYYSKQGNWFEVENKVLLNADNIVDRVNNGEVFYNVSLTNQMFKSVIVDGSQKRDINQAEFAKAVNEAFLSGLFPSLASTVIARIDSSQIDRLYPRFKSFSEKTQYQIVEDVNKKLEEKGINKFSILEETNLYLNTIYKILEETNLYLNTIYKIVDEAIREYEELQVVILGEENENQKNIEKKENNTKIYIKDLLTCAAEFVTNQQNNKTNQDTDELKTSIKPFLAYTPSGNNIDLNEDKLKEVAEKLNKIYTKLGGKEGLQALKSDGKLTKIADYVCHLINAMIRGVSLGRLGYEFSTKEAKELAGGDQEKFTSFLETQIGGKDTLSIS